MHEYSMYATWTLHDDTHKYMFIDNSKWIWILTVSALRMFDLAFPSKPIILPLRRCTVYPKMQNGLKSAR